MWKKWLGSENWNILQRHIYGFYMKQGPEILSERLTNQNLECEDDDDEVYNADSYEPGTGDINTEMCVLYTYEV